MKGRRLSSILSTLWWSLPKIGRAGGGKAYGVLSVWVAWDWWLRRLWKPALVRRDGVLRYRLIHHTGKPVTLKDGTTVVDGDPVAELHFDNVVLMRDSRTTDWNPFATMDQLELDFATLARRIAKGELGPVKALYGATMFYGPARRFGFELHAVPHNLTWSLRRYFLIGLIPIYHRDGWQEYERMRNKRWPAEIWMSVPTLERQAFTSRA